MTSTTLRVSFALTALLFALLSGQNVAIAGADGDAKEAYEKGNFVGAVTILVEKLRKKPDHQDNIALMETCLPFALKTLVGRAESAEMASSWDEAFQAYSKLKQFGDNVSMMPPVMKELKRDGKKVKEPKTFDVPDVTPKMSEMRSNATLAHYEKGQGLEKAGDWKQAALSYRNAKNYDPSFRDCSVRYEECRTKATMRICVMPFENISGKTQFGDLGQQITDLVRSSALNRQPEFLEFVDRSYLNQLLSEQGIQTSGIVDEKTATSLGKKAGVQAFVFGKVLSVVPNIPSDLRQHGTNSTQVYQDKTTKTLYVEYDLCTRQASVKLQASFQVIDVEKGTVLSSETMSGTSDFMCKWVLFKGAEAAIPGEITSQLTPGGEKASPSQETLVQDALNSLALSLAGRLVSQFN